MREKYLFHSVPNSKGTDSLLANELRVERDGGLVTALDRTTTLCAEQWSIVKYPCP